MAQIRGASGVVAQRRLQHRDRLRMIAVVVVAQSDLNAEIANSLRIELGARLRRFVHGHSRERIAIVTLLFERSRKRTTGQREHRRKISALEIKVASRCLASVERPWSSSERISSNSRSATRL